MNTPTQQKTNVLLLENIHPNAEKFFSTQAFNIKIVSGALDEEELSQQITNIHLLGIRSKTQITPKVLNNAEQLIAIGAFCIGTNQIDLTHCLKQGIAVFNAPYSNTRSVVELAIAEIIMLMRNIPDKANAMHQSQWHKSAKHSYEIRGKKLGIIGYGNIGSQLSVIAEALGMKVYFYDIIERLALGNAKKCHSLKELLNHVDIVSIHVDGRTENKHFFGADEFKEMQQHSYLLNLSRGMVVDIEALKENLDSGKLLGAGIDVFPEEPKTNQDPFHSPLVGKNNVILTPHIGGSTLEAQAHIGEYVPQKLLDYMCVGDTYGSSNFPNIQLPSLHNAHRLIHIHKNVPGMLAEINRILAEHQCNILGQYLKTNEEIGYVISDVDIQYDDALIQQLKVIPNTIKFRVLY